MNNDLKSTERLDLALSWIQRAYNAAQDGGVSKGYDLFRFRWFPSYPETTGYTIPTLFNAACYFAKPEYRALAFHLADYLGTRTASDGGVVYWDHTSLSAPIVFDTGQAIFGWLAAYREGQNNRYLESAIRAADWLVSIQDTSGKWIKNQHQEIEKVIDTRVAWALLEVNRVVSKPQYLDTAVKNLDWARQEQRENGWFNHCALRRGEAPITHTIAYTIEGLYESGKILSDSRYVQCAKLAADHLLENLDQDGKLPATYAPDWKPIDRFCCLTGNCQMSRLWLMLFEQTGVESYLAAAKRALGFVERRQKKISLNPNIIGAIPGSQPLYGSYERYKYPNWAVKFFADAILAMVNLEQKTHLPFYPG